MEGGHAAHRPNEPCIGSDVRCYNCRVMNLAELRHRVAMVSTEQFSRSSGPGGQNVNKVNTRVTLRVPVKQLGLTDNELERVRHVLSARITNRDELVLHVAGTRSRERNREIALERAVRLIDAARVPRRTRRATRPPRSAQERRLNVKRRHSQRKQNRRTPLDD